MSLNADRNTLRRATNEYVTLGAAAAKKFYAGGIVCRDASGNATPGAAATTLFALGICERQTDNSDGNAGDVDVTARKGVFHLANSADSDEIADADVGSNCYIVDDQTVAKTNGSNTRSIAGMVEEVDDSGVWVALGLSVTQAPAGSLLAANNLNDVAAIATARANIGANKVVLELSVADLVAADTAIYRAVSPIAGNISRIDAVLEGHALAAGNATLTVKVGATGVTGGVVTLPVAASAIGDKATAAPSANKAVVAGDTVSVTVGGANTNNAATARVTILLDT